MQLFIIKGGAVMNVTMKKIKVYPSMSEETTCYEASLYIDGVEAVRVSNRGTGGCDDQQDLIPGSTKRLNDYFKRTLPATRYTSKEGDSSVTFADLETFCSDQLSVFEEKKTSDTVNEILNCLFSNRDHRGFIWRKIKIRSRYAGKSCGFPE